MKKKNGLKLLIIVLLAALTLFASVPIRYPKNDARNWMEALDDEQSINTLSIPGTHDTGALYSLADVFGKCQTLSISQQLTIGVRFMDLRLRLVDNELMIYHNFVEQKESFERVLEQLVSFLQENPSEFLFVSLKEEGASVRSEAVFSQTLETMMLRYPEIVSTADTLPENVGEARGKIHIIARYGNATMGIPCYESWENNAAFEIGDLFVQDHYSLDNVDEKITDITETLNTAKEGQYRLVLNFTSCILKQGYPPSYSGVPARTINPWLEAHLSETAGATGILVCDFMTSTLANNIIGRNFS